MPAGSGLDPVVQPFDAEIAKYVAKIGEMRREYAALVGDVKPIKIDADTSAAMAKIGALKAELGSLGDKTVTVTVKYVTVGDKPGAGIGLGADHAAMIRELRDISASMDQATTSLGNMESHLTSIRRDVADSSADLMMQTQVLRDNADAHNAAAVAVGALAAARRGSGGGGGWAAAGAAAGAGGGGGGGGGAFAGGLAGTIFGGALPTLQVAHMATMLTMEIASQVIPAVVAAGAAAAVGYQGGQAAYTRGQGIYAAGEALGGAYGQTPGNLFGMGAGYQIAQNQATGGVYGIIGNLMRMASGGTGQGGILGPGGMGVQTVAMIDRGIANMVSNGRMAQLNAALGGGTGALRGIGDIGANIGDTLLNLAPNLPGMGGLLFGGLKGITGAASYATGHIPGPLLGAGLAAEAGYRWGGPILGGGKLPWFLGGRQFGGIAGLAERMGLGTVADAGAGVEGAGLAGFLGGGAAGPVGLAAALTAFTMSQLASTMPTSQMRQIAGLQGGISSSFGASSLGPITKALYQAGLMTTGAPSSGLAASMAQNIPAMETSSQVARFGPQGGMGLPPGAVITNAVTGFAQQLGQMTASAPAAQQALASLGVKGATLTQAMDYMTMAMISPKDVGAGGVLDKTAMSQLAGFVKTYSLMGSGGQTNASAILSASSADYVMAAPQMKSLSQINSALDSVTSIMTGGAANASALFQAGAAAPPHMARALAQGPFTTAGAAAWQAFTNPQTGIMAASQANMDQLRTFMTIGGLSGAQAGQLGAFELKQSVMPFASQSPMALAMLQQQAMQAGVPGVAMGQSYAATQKAINAHAGTMKQANQLLTQGTQAAANIPGVADFLNPNANISPLQSALYAQMAQSAMTAAQHPTQANVSALQSSLSMSGVKPGQMQVGVDAILKNLHVPAGLTAEINGKLKVPSVAPAKGVVNFDSHLPAVAQQHAKGVVNFDSHLPAVAQQHASGIVNYTNRVPAPPSPVGHGVIIYTAQMAGAPGGARLIGGQSGFKVPGFGGGDIWGPAMLEPGELVVPKGMVAAGAVDHLRGRIPGFQSGGVIGVPDLPGLGVGFRVAMEQVAQELLTAMQQALGSVASSARGGGGGGLIFGGLQSLTGGPPPHGIAGSPPVPVHIASVGPAAIAASGGGFPGAPLPMPAAASKIFDAFEKTFKSMGNPWGKLASQILTGLEDGVKNAPKETAAMAQALVSKVTTEIAFGKNLASSLVSGLGLGSMAVAPVMTTAQGKPSQYYLDQQSLAGGGPPLSVQQQMGDYLQAEKSFGGDIGKLTKGGLSKGILSQLLAAGPIQGDALAQSILGGAGRDQGRQPAVQADPGGIHRPRRPGHARHVRDAERHGGRRAARQDRPGRGARERRSGAGSHQRHPRQDGDHPGQGRNARRRVRGRGRRRRRDQPEPRAGQVHRRPGPGRDAEAGQEKPPDRAHLAGLRLVVLVSPSSSRTEVAAVCPSPSRSR